ncbi:hypothetical protein FQA47_009389 [Oryzias melastigma]|uniref:Uncharacterized protein n=1 Tax=Oryzias melastigma TaxID=30732 RepID=A0A834F914_ORYME|nr:hypothetical protein FQA47_009389 [Oryzias melastigma]
MSPEIAFCCSAAIEPFRPPYRNVETSLRQWLPRSDSGAVSEVLVRLLGGIFQQELVPSS